MDAVQKTIEDFKTGRMVFDQPEVSRLVQEIDRLRLGLANLSVMSPHYSNGKFEDYSSAFARIKQYAKEILFKLQN